MTAVSDLTKDERASIARHVGILRQVTDLREALNGLTFRSPEFRDPQPVGDHMLGMHLDAIRRQVLAHLEWETGLPRLVIVMVGQGLITADELEEQAVSRHARARSVHTCTRGHVGACACTRVAWVGE